MKSQVSQIIALEPGIEAVLEAIEGDPELVERLGEIGFVQGESILFHRRVVFNGPLILEVRGVPVALRSEEASCLLVRVAKESGR